MNKWLEDAIEEHFFADDGIELDEEYLVTLTDDDMIELIWQFMKLEELKSIRPAGEGLSHFTV